MTKWEVSVNRGGKDVQFQLGGITYTIPPEEAQKMAVALANAVTYAKHNGGVE